MSKRKHRKNHEQNKILEELKKINENTKPQRESVAKRINMIVALIASLMVIIGTPSFIQLLENTYQEKAEKYNNAGLEYYNSGDYEEAIENYDKAIALEKYGIEDMDICYYNRGRAYYKLGKYEMAIEDYTSALNIKEKAKYYSDRGMAYGKLGNNAMANEDSIKAAMLMLGD